MSTSIRTTELLPGDQLTFATDRDGVVDTVQRCPIHVGGVVYAIEVSRRFGDTGQAIETTIYAGRDAIHEVTR